MNKLKKVSFIFLAFCIAIVSLNYMYCANITVTSLKTGDVIYFDNSGTNWNDSKSMTKIENSNIWKFEITSDLQIEKDTYDCVIFHNGQGNGDNQTIDLGYISSKFAYKCSGNGEYNKRNGYWYLYDKTDLEKLLSECNKYEQQYYTPNSWEEFQLSIEEARKVLKKEVKLEDANNGEPGYKCDYFYKLNELEQSIQNLIVNKELLKEKIDKANEINIDKYTKDSVNNLNSAISEANSSYNDTNLTVENLKKQLDNLDKAINTLKPNKDELKEKIQEAKDTLDNEDFKYYTEDSLNTLKDNLTKAKEVFDNDNSTVDSVEDSIKNLGDALNSLEFNKQILEELLNEANNTSFDKYTDDTVNSLKEAIKEAEDLKTNGNISIEEFKKVEKKINDALNSLVEKVNSVKNNNPITGSNILIAIILLSVALIVLLITFIFLKRKKNNKK